MTIDRARLASLIPHQGRMCLLDSVVEWDDERIVCHSAQHRAADNPLRARERLSSLHAIEFAAQAMAVHQRLAGQRKDSFRFGLLVSVRHCTFGVDRLDGCAAPLVIEAIRIAASSEALAYSFNVGTVDSPVASGRVSVLLFGRGA